VKGTQNGDESRAAAGVFLLPVHSLAMRPASENHRRAV